MREGVRALAHAENDGSRSPMVSRDTSGAWLCGSAEKAGLQKGWFDASHKDGGDTCSIRVTGLHAMLAMRALCRLEAHVIAVLAQNSHRRVLGIKTFLSTNCVFHGAKQERSTMSQKENF